MVQGVRSRASYKALQRAEIGLKIRIGVKSSGNFVVHLFIDRAVAVLFFEIRHLSHLGLSVLVFLLINSTPVYAGPTLSTVIAKGFVECGVNQGLPGFSNPDEKGNWVGLDVDVCRAVAAAIFGDASKVKFRATSAKERFTALQSGEVDLLSRNTTWTFVRDNALGLDFTGIVFYDGQGFMVRKSLGIRNVLELDGASICVITGTTTELNLGDYFRTNGMKYRPVVFEKADEAVAAYEAGRCDAFTTDRSGLAAQRVRLARPNDHMVLPEVISKEPLGPVVRHGDNQWGDIVRWTLNVLIIAEEKGVTSKNIERMRKRSKDPEIKRLLGVEGDLGKKLGLPNDWANQIIRQVGNYGEIYERNVGPDTPLKLERGLNRLWNRGGILYAPPMR
ncbi:MAG: amino acid ABC transporter substrate-binding protein [Deltaproteobacteria bacterium]|nr:amino acid ABC transporter substrate-binding protein [Deltaproteobacteria bacterium]